MTKLRGSAPIVRALEDEGVRFTFGIPGTHNIELYDELERSTKVRPVLVTDEQSASFMADAVSRSSDSIGVVNVVPGAGVTHCLSGVAEAWMDNIPIVVLTCGIRTDTGKAYQLHEVDQLAILRPVCKAVLKPESPDELYPVLRRAFAIARSGAPGPVSVEIPANYYFLTHELGELRPFAPAEPPAAELSAAAGRAAAMLAAARHPAIYAGNGARAAAPLLARLAERLQAPVCTTIQGKGVFPEDHPLWIWNGFGATAPPFARTVMDRCDCLLAIGCRFGEVATGSYGMQPPAELIHVDIDPAVPGRNYPARLAVAADAAAFLEALLSRVGQAKPDPALREEIARGHAAVARDRAAPSGNGKVAPAALFAALQRQAGPGAIFTADSGNGTFLAMEHLRLRQSGCFLAPVDYSCMGYAVPAAIGAKFANPSRPAIAVAGDGALLMTGLELATAASYGVAPLVCVLRDAELGQIAQFQRASLARDTCTVLSPYCLEDLARAVRCHYMRLDSSGDCDEAVEEGLRRTRDGEPVILEVDIDTSAKTYFTRGVLTTNFWRLPWGDRLRMLSRAAGRRLGSD